MKHARLSASSAHRWVYCPGSVKAIESMNIAPIETRYSLEGTKAHELAHYILLNNMLNNDFLSNYSQEMINYVEVYVDYLKSFRGTSYFEKKLDFSDVVPPDNFGTADAIVFKNDNLRVIDFKYGVGVRVEAKDNLQLILYALGAFTTFDLYNRIHSIKKIVLTIVQPRLDWIDEHELTVEELMTYVPFFKEAALDAYEENPRFVPGEKQCQWCLYKPLCPALKNYVEMTLETTFENLELKNPIQLHNFRLKSILDNASLIKKYLTSVEEYATQQINEGKKISGYKLVQSLGNREWRDEKEVKSCLVRYLDEKMYTIKLVSPAQAEKLLGKNKNLVNTLIKREAGALKLVKDSDKRQNVNNLSFDDI